MPKDPLKYEERIWKDKWAMRAISYLVRMDYSSKEVIEAMVKVGIEKGKEREYVS